MSSTGKWPTWRVGLPLLKGAASEEDRNDRIREQGDVHRDRRRWREAAAAYKAYLDARPDDAAIWVQLGHALKEDGLLEDGLQAYERAVELAPDDADARLHHDDLEARLHDDPQADNLRIASSPRLLWPHIDWQQRQLGASAEMRDIDLLTRRLQAY